MKIDLCILNSLSWKYNGYGKNEAALPVAKQQLGY
jgi:hypothetical protein